MFCCLTASAARVLLCMADVEFSSVSVKFILLSLLLYCFFSCCCVLFCLFVVVFFVCLFVCF